MRSINYVYLIRINDINEWVERQCENVELLSSKISRHQEDKENQLVKSFFSHVLTRSMSTKAVILHGCRTDLTFGDVDFGVNAIGTVITPLDFRSLFMNV